jgi:hypothetical protein
MPEPILKTCTKCSESKPHDEYYFRDGKPIAACKDCTKAARREYVAKHHEDVLAAHRAWREANPEKALAHPRRYRENNREALNARQRAHYAANRERIKREQAAYAAANPEKMEARKLLRKAVETGALIPEPCLFCDAPKTEGHHHDYSKPLDVTWLCKRHHGLAHRIVGQPKAA